MSKKQGGFDTAHVARTYAASHDNGAGEVYNAIDVFGNEQNHDVSTRPLQCRFLALCPHQK